MNSKKIIVTLIYAVFLAFSTAKASAVQDSTVRLEAEKTKNEKEFNPSETILEHIADSHYIHFGGDSYMALPVILFTDKGLECFSSGKLDHGKQTFKGKYYTYALVDDKVNVVDDSGNKTPGKTIFNFKGHFTDLSITKNIVSLWLSIIVLLIAFLSVASAYKKTVGKAPRGFQSFIEPVIMFVRDDIAIPNIGYKYQRFMPLLLTVFFFIWINNLIGLVPFFPGGANLTGNIAVTLVLSVVTLLVVNFNGNKHYWKHIFFPGDVPIWLWPLWWVVELLGIFSRPFALMIRLFANITAGHIIVLSLISLIFVFKAAAVSIVSVPFVVFMDVLELLVALLQAFIFTLLTALFIGTAVEEHHH
nr:F0F1 ATP synthase subunit A [Mucilaginibacter gracilis]